MRAAFRVTSTNDLPYPYRSFLEEQVRDAYSLGIVSTDDLKMLQADSCLNIRVIQGNNAIVKPIKELQTQKKAYELILTAADSAGLDRFKLQRMKLNKFLTPNLTYDVEKSEAHWDTLQNSLMTSDEMILAGQSIIDRGKLYDEHDARVLSSLDRALSARKTTDHENHLVLLGQILYVTAIVLCIIFYFNLFRRDYISNWRSVLLLFLLILAYPLMTSFFMRHILLSVYLIPYAMLPVFIRVFMDSRTAFFTYICTILLCAVCLQEPFEFIATQAVGGLVAIYTLRELSERSQIFRTAFLSTFAMLVVYASIDLIHGTEFKGESSQAIFDFTIYKHMIFSGIILLFAYPLMYLIERFFGFTSNVTLVELSNVNRELLRRLSEEAPGTFQHSMQVSNLAAEVAMKIGAKSQLVRAGALYHDIGKIQNPAFFTENQVGGINPHNRLDLKESARIIINHVHDGEALADRHKIPGVIRDFITTHHGKGLVKYFYITYKNQHPDEVIDYSAFSYPGPDPFTAEQAILMMTDAVEASARSLQEYTEESIGELVDRIIDTQVAEGHFANCPITFHDIQTAKDVLKKKLKTMYHTRISYPKLDSKPDENKETADEEKDDNKDDKKGSKQLSKKENKKNGKDKLDA